MTPSTPLHSERLYELLALQTTQPLTASEKSELIKLQVKWPHVEQNEFELAAAAVFVASLPMPYMELPPHLVAKLTADALMPAVAPVRVQRQRLSQRSMVAWTGWSVAACLMIVTGILAWQLSTRREIEPQVASLSQQRERLIQRGGIIFASKPNATISGNVVWDGSSQQGFLTVRGLPPNSPKQKQYQLWVVDPGRAHKEPVDGGVFDVGPDGQALVVVKPALALREPSLFAITEEPPGGVVVSERGQRGEFLLVMEE